MYNSNLRTIRYFVGTWISCMLGTWNLVETFSVLNILVPWVTSCCHKVSLILIRFLSLQKRIVIRIAERKASTDSNSSFYSAPSSQGSSANSSTSTVSKVNNCMQWKWCPVIHTSITLSLNLACESHSPPPRCRAVVGKTPSPTLKFLIYPKRLQCNFESNCSREWTSVKVAWWRTDIKVSFSSRSSPTNAW